MRIKVRPRQENRNFLFDSEPLIDNGITNAVINDSDLNISGDDELSRIETYFDLISSS